MAESLTSRRPARPDQVISRPTVSVEVCMKSVLCVLAALLMFSGHVANAATVPQGFTDSLVAAGLSNPTAMALAPDGRIFVCQQNGVLRVIKNGALLSTPFLTVTVDSSGERGLLGIAFDPNFVSNQLVMFTTLPPPRRFTIV